MPEEADLSAVKSELRELIVRRLKLDIDPAEIGDDAPLFGEGFGLDSIDALELVLGVEQHFGVKIEDEEVGSKALSTLGSLADFIVAKQAAGRS